ncbi:GntR family transcriptional regulator [Streptacidiphilus pinicola]|uniref:GntR family transcriptional regulator n=1 Tax=Streptacidiphilus pinicola TaxID=2219663 RepID=A0A2X0IQ38_9ACTN|nr:FCD domain-containing protein [Streptacidiphilus pinicola]RAG85663.1 GntR family transcriptional regulator [Streptacidiphilus pinicola]
MIENGASSGATGDPGDTADPYAAVLRPVRSGNTFEETVEKVLQLIRLGLVPVGDRLPPERELADRLQISRVTLREALKVLQDAGVLEVRRGRYGGAFVLAPAPAPAAASGGAELRRRAEELGDRLEDTLLFRQVLELGAAELCAERRPRGAEAERLRALLAETGAASLEEYRRLDTRLHLAIAELSGSASVAAQYAAVRATVNELLDCIPLLPPNLQHSQHQHEELVTAILSGDSARARAAMHEHLAGTAALLRGFLS